MNVAYVVGLGLFAKFITEYFWPGWNGIFIEPSNMEADAQRIYTTMYLVGSYICISLGYIASKIK